MLSQERRCGHYIWMHDSTSIMYTPKGLPKLQRASFSKTLTCHMTLARSEPPLSPGRAAVSRLKLVEMELVARVIYNSCGARAPASTTCKHGNIQSRDSGVSDNNCQWSVSQQLTPPLANALALHGGGVGGGGGGVGGGAS